MQGRPGNEATTAQQYATWTLVIVCRTYIEEDLLESGLGYGVVHYLVCQTPLSLYHREERHYLRLPADSVKLEDIIIWGGQKLSSSNTIIVS